MHVTSRVIERLERAWGRPREERLAYELREREWALIARSAERGRAHDVTLFIPREGALAVIQKPMYPPGVWRVPSGGVAPGEAFEDGAVREAYEESGLVVEPRRYLLRTEVEFRLGDSVLPWSSHCFEMRYVSGEPHPVDTREISAARWATLGELAGPVRAALLATGVSGFAYRARLQELVAPLLSTGGGQPEEANAPGAPRGERAE
jgi:ADP-ribose pyrophosphatase YjhB (NUDIX family)